MPFDLEASFDFVPTGPTATLIPPTLKGETTGRTGLIGPTTAGAFVGPIGVMTLGPT